MHTLFIISKVNEYLTNVFNELNFITQPIWEYSPSLELTPELKTKMASSNIDKEWLSVLFDRSALKVSERNRNSRYTYSDARTGIETPLKTYDAKQVEVTINYIIYSNNFLKLEDFEEYMILYFNNSLKLKVNLKSREYIIGILNIVTGEFNQVGYDTAGSLYTYTFSLTIDFTLDKLVKLDKQLSAILIKFGFGGCIKNSLSVFEKDIPESDMIAEYRIDTKSNTVTETMNTIDD